MPVGHQVPAAEHIRAAPAGLNAEARVAAGVVKYFTRTGNDGAIFFYAGLDIHFRASTNGGRDRFFGLVEDNHHRPPGLDREQRTDRLDGGTRGDAAPLATETAAQAG